MATPIEITYCFHYQTDDEIRFNMRFDSHSMLLLDEENPAPPDWAKLEYCQCSHCPLSPEDHEYCPIAKNIAQVVEVFSANRSIQNTTIAVLSEERNYWKETTMQQGLHGIFGLVMATGGCPHMDFLKSMARFHLPFSTYRETIVRSLSMHLLNQLIKSKDHNTVAIDFTELEESYRKVNQLNQEFIERIRSAKTGGDAGENALIILDSFVQLIDMEFSSDFRMLKEILEPQEENL